MSFQISSHFSHHNTVHIPHVSIFNYSSSFHITPHLHCKQSSCDVHCKVDRFSRYTSSGESFIEYEHGLVWKRRECTSLFSGSGLKEPLRILRTSASSSRKTLKLDSKLPVTCLPPRRSEKSHSCECIWEQNLKISAKLTKYDPCSPSGSEGTLSSAPKICAFHLGSININYVPRSNVLIAYVLLTTVWMLKCRFSLKPVCPDFFCACQCKIRQEIFM